MPNVLCAWINCKHNSFIVTNKMKQEIRKGIEFCGSGICNCDKTVYFSLEEDRDLLICENYEDASKFDYYE